MRRAHRGFEVANLLGGVLARGRKSAQLDTDHVGELPLPIAEVKIEPGHAAVPFEGPGHKYSRG